MRTKLWVVALLALLLAASWPSPVRAAEWCDTDPLVLIVTPEGTLVPVFILVGALGLEHLPAAQAASLLATSTAEATAGGKATRVTITVTVPDDLFGRGFATRAAASSGPLGTGTVYATAEGRSGTAMVLRFTLPIP
jgi:hypothetical protein